MFFTFMFFFCVIDCLVQSFSSLRIELLDLFVFIILCSDCFFNEKASVFCREITLDNKHDNNYFY